MSDLNYVSLLLHELRILFVACRAQVFALHPIHKVLNDE